MLSLSCFVLATDTVHGCLFDWNKVGITVLPPSHRRSKPRTWPCLSARCSGPDAGSGTALSLPSQDMTTSRFVPDAADTPTCSGSLHRTSRILPQASRLGTAPPPPRPHVSGETTRVCSTADVLLLYICDARPIRNGSRPLARYHLNRPTKIFLA